jgi:hypothetical protein
MSFRRRLLASATVAGLLFAPAYGLHAAESLGFVVTLDRQTAEIALPERGGKRTVAGRLYVFLSQRGNNDPMRGPNWFQPEPFFGVDVRDVPPGAMCTIDDAADGFPEPLSKLPAGKYRVQAVLDHDFYCQNQARGVGNFYSEVSEFDIYPAAPVTLPITLNKVVEAEPFPQSAWVHEIVLTSELLSQFFGGEVVERATVILPARYDEHLDRRYPVIYQIPGFGGTHRPGAEYRDAAPQAGDGEVDFIRVLLSGNCKWGHHVYADSATNGPRGATLVREMIPHIDATYRTIPEATARFVTGHSSGGWSSLWLQVNYPDTFGGCWSTSPDPVDLRDFQQVDLYANPPLSLYVDPQGHLRPIARRGNEPFLWFAKFARMDDVLGRGGQLRSFEAVFSPLDADGLPRKLWDRRTGQIDPAVAKVWEKYDIRLILLRNWPSLAPKLSGKLHVITGEFDTFYLDGAVRKLGETLKELGSDAIVEIQPGKGHSDILTPEFVRRVRLEMSARFRQFHAP